MKREYVDFLEGFTTIFKESREGYRVRGRRRLHGAVSKSWGRFEGKDREKVRNEFYFLLLFFYL